MRHIFVGGTSFCGSTVISAMLASAEGFANAGETNWLVPFDEDHRCRLCGPSCPIWTYEFQKKLETDPRNWYGRLAERLETDNLITAEKSLKWLKRFDPPANNTSLILYKSPAGFWQSVRKRPWRKETLEFVMRRWAYAYRQFMSDEYEPTGGKFFLSTEALMADPEPVIRRVFDRLGLKGSAEAALRYWQKRHHYVGGNFNIYQRLEDEGEAALAVKPIPVDPTAVAEVDSLGKHPVHEVFERIRERDLAGSGAAY